MIILNAELLDELTQKAIDNERLRINYNLHHQLDEPVQRLLNAMEPGTVLPVHRHRDTAETYIILRGTLNVLLYNDAGEHMATNRICPSEGVYGAHVPAGQWHTVEVLEQGTVLFEVKEGPYRPLEGIDVMNV
jgi:cupin fold WbuC family metalloprotein